MAFAARRLATRARRAAASAMTPPMTSSSTPTPMTLDGVRAEAARRLSTRGRDQTASMSTTSSPSPTPTLDGIRVEAAPPGEYESHVTLVFGKREPYGALSSLHARDWALLAHDGGYRHSFASVPAALVRKPESLVARMGNFTAVVGGRCCYFVEARASTARNAAEALRARTLGSGARASDGFDFPMAALECALEESSRYYEAKLFRLRRLARHCVEEISSDLRGDDSRGFLMRGVMLNYSASQFQKLPPVRRAVVALEHDAREALDALNRATAMETAPDESVLPAPHGVVLDDVAKQERSEALLDLLASHSRRMAAVGGLVEELTANLDAARELWELQLDGDRNRTEQMNFRATVVAMAAASAAVPASLGGMNIPHGFEHAPTEVFWSVAGCVGLTAFTAWYTFMRKFRKAGEVTNGTSFYTF